jgi:hypothetical protein
VLQTGNPYDLDVAVPFEPAPEPFGDLAERQDAEYNSRERRAA